MAITVADVLRMPAVRGADPEMLGGAGGLDRPVRWVHTTELPDIAELLRDGDLVLTTGIALPEGVAQLASFATSLAESGAAGLFIELGRRWQQVPGSLVEACEHAGLPLVALRREVRFASVAQSIGERIVDQQLTELREAQQVHDTFTTLSVAEAGPGEILSAVATLAATTAVLESEDRRVLDYVAGPRDAAAFLEDWQRRSLAVRPRTRTEWDASSGWLIARIGKPERGWGRLVIDCPAPPTQRLVAVAERGAAALAMHMLHDRQRVNRDRQLHHELLVALLADPSAPDVERRCRLAGLPTANRSFVALALRTAGRPTATEELVAALVHATATRRTPALIAAVGGIVQVLLSLPRRAATRAIDDLVAAIPPRLGFVAAAGTAVTDFAAVDRTMREAHQVMSALADGAVERRVHHLEDVHLRGLLTLLADDERLSTFSDRELHALRSADEDGRLEAALRAVLRHPTSKSTAAASLAVSRPVLYERLARVAAVLGADLDDGETRASLHVALLSADLRAAAQPGSLTPP
ncbi:PucR family transcriptional regulator [Nocardioides sp. Iso805N]|uniref:PucR family transcriptional regulator n=1 Tax=Nocardioides sp. Iso805N TaxID=1283287 RepID=UPI000477DF75|nr:PucR family transcriptional regulator ligand-binding domain-containing protein [Nocardioides sp. Iso805N]